MAGDVGGGENSRFEKSLGLLTTRFVTLLQEAEDGILDLKVAADALNVTQKRRIYDITNVLEGIGLIEKKNKNCIQWKGAVAGSNTQEASDRLSVLKEEISKLDAYEITVEKHKQWVQQSIKNITEDISNHHLSYITHQDICKCFEGDTLLAIQAPTGTQLEVPIPESVAADKKRFQIHLKSFDGQIYVLLVNKDPDSDPVVVQVPPPKEVAEAIRKTELEEVEQASSLAVRRTGRGKAKAASTMTLQQPASKRARKEESSTCVDDEDEAAAHEVATILGGTELNTDIPGLDELMSTEMFGPLMRLSPPPSEKDYCFNLDDSEGVCDLFDVL